MSATTSGGPPPSSARRRHARIVATLGPASTTPAQILALAQAGADVFRLNFSHGTHDEHAKHVRAIRGVEAQLGRPIGVLMDLQGPKLRIGTLQGGQVTLRAGQTLRLDLDATPGDGRRVGLPHPEVFAALQAGTELLLDDGRLRLQVQDHGPDHATATVRVGGVLSDHKGVNVPGVSLPISALTRKDRDDLAFGLSLGVDWVALSFVQRPEDVAELRKLVGERAWIMAKLEKPAAIAHLQAIVAQADGLMVARGDLGVEMRPAQVPVLQQHIVRAARAAGKPVVVATQMLESMVDAPVPTRAEASDVATAVYSGADAVMLSAESAIGRHPAEAVAIMGEIIEAVEADPSWRIGLDAGRGPTRRNVPDAICSALRDVAETLQPAATVAYTASGFSALRAARERPATPILALTPAQHTARRLGLVWGVLPMHFPEQLHEPSEMIARAIEAAQRAGLAAPRQTLIIIAGLPFGRSGSTNLLHVAHIPANGA